MAEAKVRHRCSLLHSRPYIPTHLSYPFEDVGFRRWNNEQFSSSRRSGHQDVSLTGPPNTSEELAQPILEVPPADKHCRI